MAGILQVRLGAPHIGTVIWVWREHVHVPDRLSTLQGKFEGDVLSPMVQSLHVQLGQGCFIADIVLAKNNSEV